MLFFSRSRLLFKNKFGTKLVLLTENSKVRGVWLILSILPYCPALPGLGLPSLPILSLSFLNHTYMNTSALIGGQTCLGHQKRLAFLDKPIPLFLDGLGTASMRLTSFLGSTSLLLAGWLGFWLSVYRAITICFYLHCNVLHVWISKDPSYAVASSPVINCGTARAG